MADVSKLQVVVGADTSEAESSLGRLSQTISSGFGIGIGIKLVEGGLSALSAGIKASVGEAASFEQRLSAIKAVSGATADEMERMSKLALQLGADTSFSAGEAAKGIEELVKGGVALEDIMGGAAKASLDLAAAGEINVADAATIAANAMAQFGIKGSEMSHVADLIAGAANASSLDVSDFKFSLQAAGAVASTVGFKFDDLAQAIAIMGKAGITGSDAGTSLKTMMMALQPSTKAAKALMEELGIVTKDGGNAFFDASGKVKSMAEVAGVLQKATKDLTEQERLATLQRLFGSDAIRAAAVLAKEGAAGFNEMAASMGKVSAASVAEERLNNLNGSLEKLKGSLSTVAIMVGTVLLKPLKALVDYGTELVNAWSPTIEAFANEIPSAFEGLLEPAKELADEAFSNLYGIGLTVYRMWSEFLLPILSALAKEFGGALKQAVVWLATNGLSNLLGAFQSVYWFIKKNFGESLKWLANDGIPGVLEKLRPFGDFVKKFVIDPIAYAWDILMLAMSDPFDMKQFYPEISGLVDVYRDTLLPTLKLVWEWLTTNLAAGFTWLTETGLPLFGDAITAAFQWLSTTGLSIFSAVWDWLSTAIPAALTWLTTIGWPLLSGAISAAFAWLSTDGMSILSTVWGWLSTFLPAALTWLTTVGWPLLAGAVSAAFTWLSTEGVSILSKVWGWLSTYIPAALTWLTTIGWPLLVAAASAAITWISGTLVPKLTELWSWLWDKIKLGLTWLTETGWPLLKTAAMGFYTWLTGSLLPKLGELWDWLSPKLQWAFNWLITVGWPLLRNAATGFWTWLTTSLLPQLGILWDWLGPKLNAAMTWLTETGWPFLQGAATAVWTWITTTLIPKLSELWGWLGPIFQDAFNWLITVGWPFLQQAAAAVWSWITTVLIPKLRELWDWLGPQLNGALTWLIGTGWPGMTRAGDAAKGMLQGLVDYYRQFHAKLGETGVYDAVNKLLGELQKLFGAIYEKIILPLIPNLGKVNIQWGGMSAAVNYVVVSMANLVAGLRIVVAVLTLAINRIGAGITILKQFGEMARWAAAAAGKVVTGGDMPKFPDFQPVPTLEEDLSQFVKDISGIVNDLKFTVTSTTATGTGGAGFVSGSSYLGPTSYTPSYSTSPTGGSTSAPLPGESSVQPGSSTGGSTSGGSTGSYTPGSLYDTSGSGSYFGSSVGSPTSPQPAELPQVGVVPQWGSLIEQASATYGVPAPIIAAIMDIESSGDKLAQSRMNWDQRTGTYDEDTKTYTPGTVLWGRAQGLMQVLPWFHWPDIRAQLDPYTGELPLAARKDAQDPKFNINTGTGILARAYVDLKSWPKAAAKYFGALDPKTNEITGWQDSGGASGTTYVQKFKNALVKYGGGDLLAYANGGWINETVMGIGASSGRRYLLGERGPEYVSPRREMQPSMMTVPITIGGKLIEELWITGRDLAVRRGRVPVGSTI